MCDSKSYIIWQNKLRDRYCRNSFSLIAIVGQIFNCRIDFQLSNKFSIVEQIFNCRTNFQLSNQFSIFEQIFNCRTNFQLSNKFSIVEPIVTCLSNNVHIWAARPSRDIKPSIFYDCTCLSDFLSFVSSYIFSDKKKTLFKDWKINSLSSFPSMNLQSVKDTHGYKHVMVLNHYGQTDGSTDSWKETKNFVQFQFYTSFLLVF